MIRSLESDPQRKSQEIGDLKSRLEAGTEGRGQVARLIWLFSHLEDYLDRWTACITLFSMSAFLHNDLHVVLTIGVDIIDEEQRGLLGCDAFKEKWQEFAGTVRKIDKETSKDIAEELIRTFENARKELNKTRDMETETLGPGTGTLDLERGHCELFLESLMPLGGRTCA